MNGEKLAQRAAKMLQDRILIDLVNSGDIDDSQCCNKLITAIRDAVAEASERYPVYLTKTANSLNGLIANAQIAAGGSYKVRCVKNSGGEQTPFTVDHLGVHVEKDGAYTVTYSPEQCDIDLYQDFFAAPQVSFTMMLHLVARNYCMLSGRTEEAAMYDSRYNEYAEAISLKRKAHMPARPFV